MENLNTHNCVIKSYNLIKFNEYGIFEPTAVARQHTTEMVGICRNGDANYAKLNRILFDAFKCFSSLSRIGIVF